MQDVRRLASDFEHERSGCHNANHWNGMAMTSRWLAWCEADAGGINARDRLRRLALMFHQWCPLKREGLRSGRADQRQRRDAGGFVHSAKKH